MSILWPEQVVSSIARRRACLVIGSGVSANCTGQDEKKPPTWRQFLIEAHEKLESRDEYIYSLIEKNKFLEACELLKDKHDSNWAKLIRDTFQKPKFRAAEIHEHIFDLDIRIVISLNFDDIYERYVKKRDEGTFIIKNYFDSELRQTVAEHERYILKPHGSIDTIGKMVFTLADYGKARSEHYKFYELITALLHTHTFICIGCGTSDPDMQILFEDYRYKYDERPHYIVIPSTVNANERRLITQTRGLNCITYNPNDEHAELTQSLEALVRLVEDERDVIAEERSW